MATGCGLIYGDHNDLDKYIYAHIDRKDTTKEIGKTKELIKKLKNNKKVS